jgi:ATP adenylyltransferase
MSCPFCHPDPTQIFLETDLILAFWDRYPVSPGHALLTPKRHVANWFQATPEEQQALTHAITHARQEIEKHHKPDGYNIGINAGKAAGQTIDHLHVHLIPRYDGDQDDPRGGIRNIFPDKARYWDQSEYSIRINSQYRVCFRWTSEGPEDVEIVDYH